MALYDRVYFVFESVNVGDKLCVVLVYLLFVGEFFGLGQECVLTLFGCVCTGGSLRVKIWRRNHEFLGCFAFGHGVAQTYKSEISNLYLIININDR